MTKGPRGRVEMEGGGGRDEKGRGIFLEQIKSWAKCFYLPKFRTCVSC